MAATRVFSRITLLLLLVLLPGAVAVGQDLAGLQIFDKDDIRPYGDWSAPNQGFFLGFDGLFWNISAPAVKQIGFPNTTRNVFYGPLQDRPGGRKQYRRHGRLPGEVGTGRSDRGGLYG